MARSSFSDPLVCHDDLFSNFSSHKTLNLLRSDTREQLETMNSTTNTSPNGATVKKRSIVKVHPPHHHYTKLEFYHSLLSPAPVTGVEETIHNEMFPFQQLQTTTNPSLLSASPPKRIKYEIAHLKDACDTNHCMETHPPMAVPTPPLWLPYKNNDNEHSHRNPHHDDDEKKKDHSSTKKKYNSFPTTGRGLQTPHHTLHFRKTYKVTSNLNLHDS